MSHLKAEVIYAKIAGPTLNIVKKPVCAIRFHFVRSIEVTLTICIPIACETQSLIVKAFHLFNKIKWSKGFFL